MLKIQTLDISGHTVHLHCLVQFCHIHVNLYCMFLNKNVLKYKTV